MCENFNNYCVFHNIKELLLKHMEKPGIYFIPWVTFSHFEQPQKESVL